MTPTQIGINFIDVAHGSWHSCVMPISLATIHDKPSAEVIKAQALAVEPIESLDLWQRALALDPTNTSIVSHFAVSLLDLEKYQSVVELIVPCLLRQPRQPHLVNLLGVALFRLKAYDLAKMLFDYCLHLVPDYPNAKSSLHESKQRTGVTSALGGEWATQIHQLIQLGRAKHRPTLAVCMIVKDESEFIGDAIRSVIDVADEVIVVDTGSTDNTVEIASSLGARVEHFAWIGDFSAARNASVDFANSDWILVLDADERLTESSRATLRCVIEERHDDDVLTVFCVQIKNYTRDGTFQNDGFSGRLFRHDKAMRFMGKVHEEVGREFGTDYRLDIVFDHYGADPDVIEEKGKDQRNLELLELKLVEDPDDLVTWFYIASQHWVAQRISEAREAFERVVQLYEFDAGRYGMPIVQIPVAYSYVGLIRTLMLEGFYDLAANASDRALSTIEGNPDLLFQAGLSYLYSERVDDAIDALRKCLNTPIEGAGRIGMHDPSIQAWRAQKMLGDAYFEKQMNQRAFEVYHAVAELVPQSDPDYVILMARLVELASEFKDAALLQKYALTYLENRPSEYDVVEQVVVNLTGLGSDYRDALSFVDEVQTRVPSLRDMPDFLVLVGKLLQSSGQETNAIGWYARAGELGVEDPQFWINFGQLLTRYEEFEAAQEALARAQFLISGKD